jgi:hypothetical protein
MGDDGSAGGRRRAYGLILASCGARTRVVVETNRSAYSFFTELSYQVMKAGWAWEYVEGKGLTQVLSEDEYDSFIQSVLRMECFSSSCTTPPTLNNATEGASPEQSERVPLLTSEDGVDRRQLDTKVPVLTETELRILKALIESSTLRERAYEGH